MTLSCMLSIKGSVLMKFYKENFLYSVVLYLFIILLLVYWVEGQRSWLPNLLIIKKNPAQDLEGWIKSFNWDRRHSPSVQGGLPEYKFYSEVIEILLSLARKIGGSYQDSLLFLKEGLQADQQFEKKLKETILGTWLQMGMMILLTWLFIFGALFLVEIKVSPFKLILIACWQGVGMALLPVALSYFRSKFFGDIGKLWKILYILRSLIRVPLSRTEIFTMAGVGGLNSIKQKTILYIVEKLKDTCQRTLQQGGSYEEDVLSLMTDLRFQEKWHFELFEKRLIVLKLALMSLFFLPSYLAFIFILLGGLSTLM
jgi:hypothetical protein